jgi:FAD/FMN-containing dehydrogenase
MEFSMKTLDLMRGIKRVFDPNNILNPGSFL